MLRIMTDEALLSTLRQLEPEPEPDQGSRVLQQLEFLVNVLEDLKLKQSITNELLLDLVERVKGMGCSDHASQARPIRNNTTPRPIRRWSGKKTY